MEDGDDDDFFGDQQDDHRTAKESAAEAERLKVAGYHDTFDASHDSALQDGFDAGYVDSFATAVSIGRLLGSHVAQGKLNGHATEQDPSYLRMAAIIRSRLSQLTEETTVSSDALDVLLAGVQEIGVGDSTTTKSSPRADNEECTKG